ncbi:hypothetical protein FQR65_LT08514 [Abscondita terminalis]|nr:hypothetical protein FQR65_LT08514 [Abscondita terminalis]
MSSKEFITGLLELYQGKSCLWQTTCPEYTNKNLKNDCYKELVAYCQKFYKEADKTFVQQKLQNLRTAFRKELKKVEDSKRSGAGTDDIYVPRLWYFDLLLFTKNDELPRQSIDSREKNFPTNTTNMDLESDRKECNKNEDQDSEEEKQETQTTIYSEGQSLTEIPRSNMKPVSKSSPTTTQTASEKRKMIRRKDDQFLKCCSQAIKKLSSGSNGTSTKPVVDEFDALGISWAAKLRKLDDVQKVLAEDLINQTLKKAFFGELTRFSTIQEVHGSIISSSFKSTESYQFSQETDSNDV